MKNLFEKWMKSVPSSNNYKLSADGAERYLLEVVREGVDLPFRPGSASLSFVPSDDLDSVFGYPFSEMLVNGPGGSVNRIPSVEVYNLLDMWAIKNLSYRNLGSIISQELLFRKEGEELKLDGMTLCGAPPKLLAKIQNIAVPNETHPVEGLNL